MDTEYGYSYGYSRNPMATAAVVLGVISLFTCLIFYISIPCGAMALLSAILSRGKEPMPGKSRTGIVCGTVGMLLSAAITLFSVWTVLTNSQMRAYMERYLQYYLGDSSFDLDQELATMFPALKDVLGIDDSEINESSPADGSDSHIKELLPADDAEEKNKTDDAVRDNTPSRQLPSGKGDFI